MNLFLGFVFISGVGWLLDMTSYAGLSQLLTVEPPYANFISSMVGVTYVWIVALNRIFDQRECRRSVYLPIYWSYQGLSILAYSALISVVTRSTLNWEIASMFGMPSEFTAKIIITCPNLMTNFIFMSFLTKLMNRGIKQRHLS